MQSATRFCILISEQMKIIKRVFVNKYREKAAKDKQEQRGRPGEVSSNNRLGEQNSKFC